VVDEVKNRVICGVIVQEGKYFRARCSIGTPKL
jgi:hypothetical protein